MQQESALRRGAVEAVQPRVRPIADAPELKQQFEDWSRSRDDFQARMHEAPPTELSRKWQKLYYRGICPAGAPGAVDHQSRVRARDFTDQPGDVLTYRPSAPARGVHDPQRARRDWPLSV